MASSAHFGKTRRALGIAVTALVLAVAAGSIGARPALADDDGWQRGYERHGWGEHEWRGHEWREHECPPVVYAPPSISFVFPLGHR